MLDPHLLNKCQSQVWDWHERLVSPALTKEETVWHYTRGESLVHIIDSGTLFATQASCLNDATELRYASRLLKECLLSEVLSLEPGDKGAEFCRHYADLLTDTDDVPSHAGSMFFVSCFSLLGDDLSQWRSYGGGENGYAIGFTPHDLIYKTGEQERLVGRVNYNAALHEQIAQEAAQFTLATYREGLSAVPAEQVPEWENLFLEFWNSALLWLAPFAKDPAFACEQEVRVIRPYRVEDACNLVFLQRKSMLARHLPLKWPPSHPGDRSRVPVKEIIVGPGRHKHVSSVGVKLLLQRNSYPQCPVSVSCVPYQET